MRDGGASAVRATELVVGDLLTLEEGQRVPADVYVVHAEQLRAPGLEAQVSAVQGGSPDPLGVSSPRLEGFVGVCFLLTGSRAPIVFRTVLNSHSHG